MQNTTGYKPLYAAGEKANAGCRAARRSGNAALAPGQGIVEPHFNPSETSEAKDSSFCTDEHLSPCFAPSLLPPSSHTDKMQI